jgi:hypothetical protein
MRKASNNKSGKTFSKSTGVGETKLSSRISIDDPNYNNKMGVRDKCESWDKMNGLWGKMDRIIFQVHAYSLNNKNKRILYHVNEIEKWKRKEYDTLLKECEEVGYLWK